MPVISEHTWIQFLCQPIVNQLFFDCNDCQPIVNQWFLNCSTLKIACQYLNLSTSCFLIAAKVPGPLSTGSSSSLRRQGQAALPRRCCSWWTCNSKNASPWSPICRTVSPTPRGELWASGRVKLSKSVRAAKQPTKHAQVKMLERLKHFLWLFLFEVWCTCDPENQILTAWGCTNAMMVQHRRGLQQAEFRTLQRQKTRNGSTMFHKQSSNLCPQTADWSVWINSNHDYWC